MQNLIQKMPDTAPQDTVAHLAALLPTLRDRGEETERIGRLPATTIADFEDAGVFGSLVPQVNGGSEVSLQTYMDMIVEIGRGDGSAAWTAGILSGAAWMVAMLFPRDVAQEVLAAPHSRVATVLSPRSIEAHEVGGGIWIEHGVWNFNSGAHNAQWNLLGFPLKNHQGLPEILTVLLPIHECKLLNDWDTFGLRGSGSTSVEVEDVFVPRSHLASLSAVMKGDFQSVHLDAVPLYRLPLVPFLATKLLFPSLGMAKAALELALASASRRGIPFTVYAKQDEAAVTHVQMAESSAKIDAAEQILRNSVKALLSHADGSSPMDIPTRTRLMRDAGYVNKLLWESIDALATSSGSAFAKKDNLLGRLWRDAKVASLHGALTPTTNFELAGRVQSHKDPQSWFL
ncbi:acyl-CoA dehydrogenase family protein [Rhizobium leguminosarum]|uniref:acyl-CoA dehydrogenase family protein n=1 Tax=Rhizobium leguminosarum TaxID=384 RepID=UPI00143F22E2|nr:acyl-CoA dehydrogenase family protein [Rhizobium leguminosarum]NKL23392.1 acyl-CoA dehydrogenase [Rhizobium leguminosarum bv. viciae]